MILILCKCNFNNILIDSLFIIDWLKGPSSISGKIVRISIAWGLKLLVITITVPAIISK